MPRVRRPKTGNQIPRLTAAVIAVLALGACADSPAKTPGASAPPQTAAPSRLTANQETEPQAFTAIAAELLATLPPERRIAIQPFRAAEAPMPLTRAEAYNDALARALEAAPEGSAVIVARAELPRLFSEAEEFGDSAQAQRLLEAAKADVLVVGSLRSVAGGVALSYKALDARNGRVLSTSMPHVLALDSAMPSGLPLDQALATAVEALSRQAPDLRALEALPITYEQSDVQPAFGSYIGRELVGRFVERLRAQHATPAGLTKDTSPITPGAGNSLTLAAKPGVYLLSGTVWDLGEDVDVRLSLRGAGDRLASTGMRVRKDAIPPGLLPLMPSSARAAYGALQLTSDRGAQPVYTIGEVATLTVQAARAGFLYCFHQASPAAGGGIIALFPNAYHRDAHVAGGVPVRIPDRDMGFALKVFGPPGVERVRCLLVDRDAAGAVSPGILRRDLEPINAHDLDDVSRVFRGIPGTSVGEADLALTVAAPRSAGAGRP